MAGWMRLLASRRRCGASARCGCSWLARRDEFAEWKLSQDVIWRKPGATSMATDRFKRIHEVAGHWYRGEWRAVYHEVPTRPHLGKPNGMRSRGADRGEHLGAIRDRAYEDNGTRMLPSVFDVASLWKRKPLHRQAGHRHRTARALRREGGPPAVADDAGDRVSASTGVTD